VKVHATMDARGVTKALRKAIGRCQDMRPAWEVIGMDLLRSVDKNFDAEGRPSAWAPWSPAYGKWRAENKPGKILTRDARLRRSITSDPDGKGITLGTNVVYAAAQQFGMRRGAKRRGKVTLPARPFLVVQDSDWPKVVKTIGDHIAGAWG
jgi:phage virion morphogenesis protein